MWHNSTDASERDATVKSTDETEEKAYTYHYFTTIFQIKLD